MGYDVSQLDQKFRIKQDQIQPLLQVLRQAFVLRYQTVDKAFEEARCEIEWDTVTGDINRCDFVGEKSGIDEMFLTVIAPFVESGSYLEMQGEDGTLWRECFVHGRYQQVVPQVIWPTVPVAPQPAASGGGSHATQLTANDIQAMYNHNEDEAGDGPGAFVSSPLLPDATPEQLLAQGVHNVTTTGFLYYDTPRGYLYALEVPTEEQTPQRMVIWSVLTNPEVVVLSSKKTHADMVQGGYSLLTQAQVTERDPLLVAYILGID